MSFRISGLAASQFRPLFHKSDEELERVNVRRIPAQEGFPCRITLEDAIVGEPVLLLPFEHHDAPTPYRSSGPIFVREGDHETAILDRVPDSMRERLYSIRAYDQHGDIIDAEVAPGSALERVIETFFANEAVSYLHAHHARRGCYAFRVDRE